MQAWRHPRRARDRSLYQPPGRREKEYGPIESDFFNNIDIQVWIYRYGCKYPYLDVWGARCGKTAHRDLCRGRRLTGVLTATAS